MNPMRGVGRWLYTQKRSSQRSEDVSSRRIRYHHLFAVKRIQLTRSRNELSDKYLISNIQPISADLSTLEDRELKFF